MLNISGFALSALVSASATFPNGVVVKAFGDDADPLDSPDFAAADTAMGLNGDLIVWTRPSGIELALAVIPTSEDDINLETLLNANRVGKNKSGARDTVNIVITYPNGTRVTASQGVIVLGPVMMSVASAGRFKTRVYRFRFESVSKANG